MEKSPSPPIANAANVANVESLVNSLKRIQQQKLDVDLRVSNSFRQGIIHVRAGAVFSAHSGILQGNGALLSLVLLNEPLIERIRSSEPVQKTIYIPLSQIERFLSSQPAKVPILSQKEEETLLQEAQTLFFQFQYKKAVEKLVTIVRHNRFFYPAWLWKSRILTQKDHVEKALDEACRWGNHDQDVLREARKIRPQLDSGEAPAQRCIFCWSILSQQNYCSHCHAFLKVTAQPVSSNLKIPEIQLALTHYYKAYTQDKSISRVLYAMALGYFNLKDQKRALGCMRSAVKLSPQSALFKKSLSLLLALAKTQSTVKKPAAITSTVAKHEQQPDNSTILIIEDSQTSRKVLSMLFKRLSYNIIEAATGKEALNAVQSNKPDLILLDVMLPDTNGHELLPRLRNHNHISVIPVIMLTGRHDTSDRMLGIRAGANEYVTKPFNPQKLTALIQQYLPKKSTISNPMEQAQVASTPAQSPETSQHTNPLHTSAVQLSQTKSRPALPKKDSRKSIFVIEDSSTSRKVLAMILGRNGFKMYEATSGRDALTIAQKIKPDLVLLDVMLPDMTGYKFLPRLKIIEHFKDIPVIMLTGKRASDDRMQGLLAGSNEYITKPFNPQKLLSVIGNYL
ncbi:response regulator [Desulfosediminicola flagellatus]|uniref:response regulator n=1 Tax=Desulfosediminicola flagellatus TaxID=2569541 RepID=UPI0010AD4BD9|nr:response regulator [Desulfosediminicola flagellatus]